MKITTSFITDSPLFLWYMPLIGKTVQLIGFPMTVEIQGGTTKP